MTSEHPRPSLQALADKHYQGDATIQKSPSYFREYERLFEPLRNDPIGLLELGVFEGRSLLIWREYFPNGTVVGIDLDDPLMQAPSERSHFVKGSQDDVNTLNRALEINGGPFDVILDDCAHIGYLAKRSFMYLFPSQLKPGGLYIIEDIGTSFLPAYPDGTVFIDSLSNQEPDGTVNFTSHMNGMVGFLKQVIDNTMKTLSTGADQLAIESVTFRTNFAVIKKLDA
jgi:Methyltransferase domain